MGNSEGISMSIFDWLPSRRRNRRELESARIRKEAIIFFRDDPLGQVAFIEQHGDPRDALLALCEAAGTAAHKTRTSRQLCMPVPVVDHFWRATLASVRDERGRREDGEYRYLLSNLRIVGELTLRWAERKAEQVEA
jgi:hypothetical protein